MRPSEAVNPADGDWLLAGGDDYAKQHSGKWLIFVSYGHADGAWARISAAVTRGDLGGIAKVSTRCAALKRGSRTHVICVYTSPEISEISRVGKALVNLNFHRIRYKSDNQTRRNNYGAWTASFVMARLSA